MAAPTLTELCRKFWAVSGYMDHRSIGSGYRTLWLINSNGREMLVYDAFGDKHTLALSAFKLCGLEYNCRAYQHSFDDKGYLCVILNPHSPSRALCPWKVYDPEVRLKPGSPPKKPKENVDDFESW